MLATPDQQISLTDPDARSMATSGRGSGVVGYNESFNGKLGDELLDGEIFYSLKEARVLIEQWRHHDNTVRPHSALGNRPPAPQAIAPKRTDPAFGSWMGYSRISPTQKPCRD